MSPGAKKVLLKIGDPAMSFPSTPPAEEASLLTQPNRAPVGAAGDQLRSGRRPGAAVGEAGADGLDLGAFDFGCLVGRGWSLVPGWGHGMGFQENPLQSHQVVTGMIFYNGWGCLGSLEGLALGESMSFGSPSAPCQVSLAPKAIQTNSSAQNSWPVQPGLLPGFHWGHSRVVGSFGVYPHFCNTRDSPPFFWGIRLWDGFHFCCITVDSISHGPGS